MNLLCPIIKFRSYRKGDGDSYTIVQYSFSCVRATVVGAACFCSDVIVLVGPADVSEGEIRVAENYMIGGIESKTSALVPC
jgi:hypothetical protein